MDLEEHNLYNSKMVCGSLSSTYFSANMKKNYKLTELSLLVLANKILYMDKCPINCKC